MHVLGAPFGGGHRALTTSCQWLDGAAVEEAVRVASGASGTPVRGFVAPASEVLMVLMRPRVAALTEVLARCPDAEAFQAPSST